MNYDEYIQQLQALKDATERGLLARRKALENEILQAAFDFLDDNLDTEGGQIILPGTGNRVLNRFTAQMQRQLGSGPALERLVTQYINGVKRSDDLIFSYHEDANGITPRRMKLKNLRDMIFGEIADEFETAGLQQYIIQPMRNTLYQGINAGYSMAELKRALRLQIRGSAARKGATERYLTNINRKGIDAYIGGVNRQLMREYGFNAMIMAGSLIKTSSPQCRYGINELDGIIRRRDWPKLKRRAINNGLIDGTNFDNLPFNKLHWGCRHEFTPTFEEEIKNNR